MADTDKWMPFYVGDYLADTQRLTTEQHGAYVLLILDYWRNGPPPDDDEVLQQIAKLDRARWRKHRAILANFFRIAGGEWRHKRIDAERGKAGDVTEKRRSAANARWAKQNDASADANEHANADANAMQTASPSQPQPQPQPQREEEERESPPPSGNAREPKIRLVEPSEPSEAPRLRYAFAGRVIRLVKADFDEWAKCYSAIPDLSAELCALDDWFRGQDEDTCKRWFHIASRALAKKHTTWLADANKPDANYPPGHSGIPI